MRTNGRSNALLIELLIVVLFFMISATVLLRLFAAARLQGEMAGKLAEATVQAQNLAERLYAADDPDELLTSTGFSLEEGVWKRTEEALLTEVTLSEERTESGILHRGSIVISAAGEELLSIPCARFEEVHA